MKNILIAAFILIIFAINALSEEDRSKWTEISGKYSWELWKYESGWQEIKSDYDFDAEFIEEIKTHENIKFILFTAAWCSDSRVGTPKIIKLLGMTGHYPSKFTMYGLDREKSEPAGNNYIYNIERVPTLIILREGKEISRIVEYPEESWEQDIAKIIRGK